MPTLMGTATKLNTFKAPALLARKEELQQELLRLDREVDTLIMEKISGR